MHFFICFFVTDFVRKMEAPSGLAKVPLIPFYVQKWTFCLIGFPPSINDDFKKGCVLGDHSFKHGCFPIEIQYLTTALRRILFSSVVIILDFGAPGLWFESCPVLIFLPCIYDLFLSYGLCS